MKFYDFLHVSVTSAQFRKVVYVPIRLKHRTPSLGIDDGPYRMQKPIPSHLFPSLD
jgi:hypothetical protein